MWIHEIKKSFQFEIEKLHVINKINVWGNPCGDTNFFSVTDQKPDLAIQDLGNFVEKFAIQDLQILFSDNPATQDLNYESKTFTLFYACLFSNQKPDLAIQDLYNIVLAMEQVPQLCSYEIFIPYRPLY